MDDTSERLAVEKHLPLSPPVFHILVALVDSDLHGYGILLEIERRTGGRVKLGTGTLYTAIKRLLAGGLIEESARRTDPDDERRKYYQLTTLGHRVAAAEAARMEALVGMARGKRLLT